jgi:hypothetical protein
MDHEMEVDIDEGKRLTAPYVCPHCQSDSPVTVLVVTQGSESWDDMIASTNAPSFVIEAGGDVPLEVIQQRWRVNCNLGVPTEGERVVADLANVCQNCGTRFDDLSLIEPGGPFLPSSAAAILRLACVALEHVPFVAHEAEVCDAPGLRGTLNADRERRLKSQRRHRPPFRFPQSEPSP